MNDLFTYIEEETIHREGMKIDSGIKEALAIEQAREEMHAMEVRDVIKRWFPRGGKEAAVYFELVEKKRGIGPATKLREACRIAWADARAEVDTYRAHRAKVDMDKVTK